MNEIQLTIDVEAGDVLKFNDVWWSIESTTEPIGNAVDMKPMNTGDIRCMDIDDLEERIDFSGEFHLIKKDYQNVIDY